MALCVSSPARALTYIGDFPGYTQFHLASPRPSHQLNGFNSIFVGVEEPGLGAACDGYANVLISGGEWAALRELSVINQTLKDELAATRVRIDAVRSSTLEAAVSQQSVNTTLSLLERDLMGKQSDLFSVGLVACFLVAGFFFGFRFANSASNQ